MLINLNLVVVKNKKFKFINKEFIPSILLFLLLSLSTYLTRPTEKVWNDLWWNITLQSHVRMKTILPAVEKELAPRVLI